MDSNTRTVRASSSDEDELTAKNSKLFTIIRKPCHEKEILQEIDKCLRSGSQINARNLRGKTILDIAREKKYDSLANYISERGGKAALDLADGSNRPLGQGEIRKGNKEEPLRALTPSAARTNQGPAAMFVQQHSESSTNSVQQVWQQGVIDVVDNHKAELDALLLGDGKKFLTEDKLKNLNIKLQSDLKFREVIHSLIQLEIDIHRQDARTKQFPVDVAWENEYYDSMLMLLQAGSKFPEGLDAEIPEKIKTFVNERNELHQWIQNNEFERIENFIATQQLSEFFSGKNIPALETAAKYGNTCTLGLLTSIQLPLEEINLSENQLRLLRQIDEDGNTLLGVAAKSDKKDNVEFFIRCGIDINHRNRLGKSAFDLAWENKHYDVVLTLLKADSDFPYDLNLASFNEDNGQKAIKQFVEGRNKLHKRIEEKDLEGIKEDITVIEKSKHYLNSEGKSALATAIKHKQFEVYAFLTNIGVSFKNEDEKECLNNLSTGEKDDLKRAIVSELPQINEGHILYLISKSRSRKPVAKFKERIRDLLRYLDGIPEVSIILKVIQYADYLDIVFDFDNENIKDINPTASKGTKGTCDYKDGRIYIAAKTEEKKLAGTLAHELTHLAMYLLYKNDCNPFDKLDEKKMELFKEITDQSEEQSKQYLKHDEDSPIVTLARAFKYGKDEQQSELIVRIPHILAQYQDAGRDFVTTNLKPLFVYYNDTAERGLAHKCEQYIKDSYFMKSRNSIEVMNETLGEVKNLIQYGMNFTDHLNLDDFLKSTSQVLLVKTESSFLSVLKIYENLIIRNKNFSVQDSLFIEFNAYLQKHDEILKLIYSPAGKVMCLRYSDVSDKEKLSNVLKKLHELLKQKSEKKIIFIIQESYTEELNEITRVFEGNYKEAAEGHFTFESIAKDSQQELLEKEVVLQGEKIILSKIIGGSDENNLGVINEAILVKLIKGEEISIGTNVKDLGKVNDYYIDRKVCKEVTLSIEKMKNGFKESSAQEKFVISGTSSGLEENENVYVFSNAGLAGEKFEELRKANKGHNIHWLVSDSHKITWNKSEGSVSNLIQYKTIVTQKVDVTDNTISLDLEDILKDNHRMLIISDKAGMGKSIALTRLSMALKKDPSLWVIRIDLNDHTKALKNSKFSNSEEVLNFLLNDLNVLGSQERESFENKLFRNIFKSNGKVAFLLDGFDEICPDYKHTVIALLQSLREFKIEKIIVTTRPSVCESLERELGTFAYLLNPLSSEEQITFLNRFWAKKLSVQNAGQNKLQRLQTYAESIIERVSTSIHDQDQSFTAIPLHIMMVAEIFEKDQALIKSKWQSCEKFLDSEDDKPMLPQDWPLLDLYEHFIERKYYEFYLQEKKGRDFTKVDEVEMAKDTYCISKENYKMVALHTLFSWGNLETLLNKKEITKLENIIATFKEGKTNEGIAHLVNDKILFMHHTFAEYFASFLIAEKMITTRPQTLQCVNDIVLNLSPIFINNIIEQLNCKMESSDPLLKSFIAANDRGTGLMYPNFIKSLILFGNNDWVKKLDAYGKTPLHYAIESDRLDVAKDILKCANDIGTINILGHGSFVEREYEFSKLVKFINIQDNSGRSALIYSIQKESFDFAFELLLQGASIDSLTHPDLRKLIIQMMYGDGSEDFGILGAYADQDCKYRPVQEKLWLKDSEIFCTSSDYERARILSFYCTHGRVRCIKALIETIPEKNERERLLNLDDNKLTPLDRVNSSKHLSDDERLEVTKYLLENGGTETKRQHPWRLVYEGPGKHVFAILQAAARDGHVKTFECFIKEEHDRYYQLHLHTAADFQQLNIIQCLVRHKVHDKNDDHGNTALHTACNSGAGLKLIKYLIDSGGDINAINHKKETPLFMALYARSGLHVIKYLFAKGAQLNHADELDNTPLSFAIEHNQVDVIKYLIDNDARIMGVSQSINDQYAFWKNPNQYDLNLVQNGSPRLQSAINSDNIEFAKFLVRQGADVNKGDTQGKTPFHWAAEQNKIEMVKLLLQFGVMFDKNDNIISHRFEDDKIKWLLDALSKLFSSEKLTTDLLQLQLLGTESPDNMDWGPYGSGYAESDNNPMLFFINARNSKGKTLLHVALNTKGVSFMLEWHEYCLEAKRKNNDQSPYADYQPMLIFAKDSEENTPLHLAAQKGDDEVVSWLLQKGAVFNSKNLKGYTPAALAEMNQRHTIVKRLQQTENLFIAIKEKKELTVTLLTGAYVNAKNEDGATPLHLVAPIPELCLHLLLKEADIEAVDSYNNTPLHVAAAHDAIKNVKLLLKYGAFYDTNTTQGKDPLQLATGKSRNLLTQIDSLFQNLKSDNPLFSIEVVKEVNQKFDIEITTILNTCDNRGNTLLHYAAELNELGIVEKLLENGACFDALNKWKDTPQVVAPDPSRTKNLLKTIAELFQNICNFHKINDFAQAQKTVSRKIIATVRDKSGKRLLDLNSSDNDLVQWMKEM